MTQQERMHEEEWAAFHGRHAAATGLQALSAQGIMHTLPPALRQTLTKEVEKAAETFAKHASLLASGLARDPAAAAAAGANELLQAVGHCADLVSAPCSQSGVKAVVVRGPRGQHVAAQMCLGMAACFPPFRACWPCCGHRACTGACAGTSQHMRTRSPRGQRG